MAWTTRDNHRRRLDQAASDINKPLVYLKEFTETYGKDHPELEKAANSIAQILVFAQQTIQQLKEAF